MYWLPKLFTLLSFAVLAFSLSGCAIDGPFIFRPNKQIEPPAAYGLQGFGDITLRSSDGVRLHVWVHEANAGMPTIVYFHGNGGNLANRAIYFAAIAQAGYGVIAPDYRGYGKSEGYPSEAGFYRDGRAVLGYATDTLHLPLSQLVLYGESIGTGVAVQMATEYPTSALVLQSAFTSIALRARDHYFWNSVGEIVSDRFDSLSKMASIHQPLLILHGEQDKAVPIQDAYDLFAKANPPKLAVYFPQGGHDDLPMQGRLDALHAFLKAQKIVQEP